MVRRLARVAWVGWLVWLCWGCGGAAASPAATADPASAPAVKPRNAHEIARALVGGKIDALLHVDRLRSHPLGARLAALGAWQKVLEGTELDPLRDLERAYVTAPSTQEGVPVALVGEHSLPATRVHAALEVMIAKSDPPGRWLRDLAVPAAEIVIDGHRRVVAEVEPNVLVVLLANQAQEVGRFVGTGGLPEPEGTEALSATAIEPARTLHTAPTVEIPATLGLARGRISLDDKGGALLHVEAESSSPEQAEADAAALTERIAAATTVKIAVLEVKLFGPVEFRAERRLVKADREVTERELDQIFTLLGAAIEP